MYKVFLNERIIAIASVVTPELEPVGCEVFEVEDSADIISRVNYFLKRQENTCLITGNPERIFNENFKNQFINIQAAGGIVIKNNRILFIFRRGFWDLPKGKIDWGESPEEAALREVNEETGLSKLHIIKRIPSTWHIYQSPYKENKGNWILKETYWFEMGYSGAELLKPQLEEDITKAEWVRREDIALVLENTYSNLKQIINSYR